MVTDFETALRETVREAIVPEESRSHLRIVGRTSEQIVFEYVSLKNWKKGLIRIDLEGDRVKDVLVTCALEALTTQHYRGRIPEGVSWAKEKTGELREKLHGVPVG